MKEIFKLSKDILRGVNTTVWGGVEGAEKTATIIKATLASSDAVIGVSWAIEDYQCQDHICGTLDIIGSISSVATLVLGNLPGTKQFTIVTATITGTARTVRLYCKNYGTVWGCTVAAGKGIKEGFKFLVKK